MPRQDEAKWDQKELRLEDVWALPTPGGADDFPRLVRLIVSNDPSQNSLRLARALWALRRWFGQVLGWDDEGAGHGLGAATPCDRLPADLLDAPSGPGFALRYLVSMRRRDSAELVYSSDEGDLRRSGGGDGSGPKGGGKGRKKGKKRPGAATPTVRPSAGTRIKVRRETSGRRGKAVTTVSDIPLGDPEIKALAVELKRLCGVGGTVKHGVIELQGDHRDKVLAHLKAAGHDAVAAGG